MKDKDITDIPTEGKVDFQPPKILPPHYLAITVTLMIACRWLPVANLLADPWWLTGCLLVLSGVAVAGFAAWQFKAAQTNIIPLTKSDALVISGVFAHTRNPMYLGMILLLIGVALLVNVWPAWLLLPVFYLVIWRQFIAREEILMHQTFGDQYSTYQANVRRWL